MCNNDREPNWSYLIKLCKILLCWKILLRPEKKKKNHNYETLSLVMGGI